MVDRSPRRKIARADIGRVMASFYEAARHRPSLAPVFAAHVNDWPATRPR